jgi:hypothetical protein
MVSETVSEHLVIVLEKRTKTGQSRPVRGNR